MKRFVVVMGAAALATWAMASSIGGCGGEEEVPEDPGAGADATVPEDDGGTAGDTGVTPPGTDGGGGGGDSGADGGGGASNPGKVTCGTTECGDAGNNSYCCVRGDGGATCETSNAPGTCAGQRLRCDEKSDCNQPGDDCCLTLGGGGGFSGSACQNNCFGNQLRLCKQASDCGDGGACNTVTCGGRQYRACNKPAGCT